MVGREKAKLFCRKNKSKLSKLKQNLQVVFVSAPYDLGFSHKIKLKVKIRRWR